VINEAEGFEAAVSSWTAAAALIGHCISFAAPLAMAVTLASSATGVETALIA
jgi:hypothetical protein